MNASTLSVYRRACIFRIGLQVNCTLNEPTTLQFNYLKHDLSSSVYADAGTVCNVPDNHSTFVALKSTCSTRRFYKVKAYSVLVEKLHCVVQNITVLLRRTLFTRDYAMLPTLLMSADTAMLPEHLCFSSIWFNGICLMPLICMYLATMKPDSKRQYIFYLPFDVVLFCYTSTIYHY